MLSSSLRKKLFKALAWTIASFVLVVGLLFLALMLFLNQAVADGYSELDRIPSPDGQYEAVVFQIDMGATTNYNRQIKIARKGERDPMAASLFSFRGESTPSLKWLSNTELVVNSHYEKTITYAAPWFGRSFTVHGPADAPN